MSIGSKENLLEISLRVFGVEILLEMDRLFFRVLLSVCVSQLSSSPPPSPGFVRELLAERPFVLCW